MGVNLKSTMLFYGAGSLMGTVSYLLIITFQQLLGSSLGRLFFTLDYNEMIRNSVFCGLWALVLMFIPYQKYRNLIIGILPGATFITETKGGFNTVISNLDYGMFAGYETPLFIAVFCVVWGLGIPKIIGQGGE